MAFICNINFATLDTFVNLLSSVDKGLLHIVSSLGTRFHKDEPICISKGLSFRRGHRTAMFQIILVTNQHNHYIALTVLSNLIQPPRQVLEGVPPRNVIDQERTCGTAIVRASNRPKGFLSRRVPDLQLDLLVLQVDHASTKLDTNRQVVDRLKSLVCELQQQTRLSDTCNTKAKRERTNVLDRMRQNELTLCSFVTHGRQRRTSQYVAVPNRVEMNKEKENSVASPHGPPLARILLTSVPDNDVFEEISVRHDASPLLMRSKEAIG